MQGRWAGYNPEDEDGEEPPYLLDPREHCPRKAETVIFDPTERHGFIWGWLKGQPEAPSLYAISLKEVEQMVPKIRTGLGFDDRSKTAIGSCIRDRRTSGAAKALPPIHPVRRTSFGGVFAAWKEDQKRKTKSAKATPVDQNLTSQITTKSTPVEQDGPCRLLRRERAELHDGRDGASVGEQRRARGQSRRQ